MRRAGARSTGCHLRQSVCSALRLPAPPSLAKATPACGALEVAAQLFDSGLLKGGWDPSEHPRTDEPRVINEWDFEAQREAGLEALRRFGVLK